MNWVLAFVAGAAVGFGAHEGGHVLAGAAFSANPSTKSIHYGGLPFFAVTHDPVTRRREFVISSSGFWVQHAGSEWILTKRPNLRNESAPFAKGVLTFNIATSVVYAAGAFGKLGPPESDTRGMAASLGRSGWREPAVGLMILGPAALDTYRYFKPEQRWAAWTSRGMKAGLVLLTLIAGTN
jgi:hypothetical protein